MIDIKNTFYWLASLVILAAILYMGKIIIFPLILSMIMAIIFSSPIKRIARVVKSHALAFILFYTFLICIVGFGLYLFGGQISNLFTTIDSESYSWSQFEDRLEQILRNLGMWDGEWEKTISNQVNALATSISSFVGSMISSGTTIIFGVVMTVVFAFFISINYEPVKTLFMSEMERPDRRKFRKILDKLPLMLRSYFKGLGIIMIVLSVANSLLFWIVGLEYAIVWGLIVGLLSIIPYVGTFIGLLLPLSYSFLSAPSLTQPLMILLGFSIIQQIEGNVLTPKIVGEHVNLNAFTALACTILAGLFWGVAGAVIAIPVAGALKLVFEQYEETETLAKLMSSDLQKYKQST